LWIEQARNQGKILVNVHRDLSGGALALLTVHDGRAEGHFLPDYGGFMPVRSARGPSAFELLQAADTHAGTKRETALDGQVLDDPAFGFFAALSVPAHRIEVIPEAGSAQLWLLSRDGSWRVRPWMPAPRSSSTAGGGCGTNWNQHARNGKRWGARSASNSD
jgi:hypothetical protein